MGAFAGDQHGAPLGIGKRDAERSRRRPTDRSPQNLCSTRTPSARSIGVMPRNSCCRMRRTKMPVAIAPSAARGPGGSTFDRLDVAVAGFIGGCGA